MNSLAVQIAAVKFSIGVVREEIAVAYKVVEELDKAIKAGEAAVRRKVSDCLIYVDQAKERFAAEQAAKDKAKGVTR